MVHSYHEQKYFKQKCLKFNRHAYSQVTFFNGITEQQDGAEKTEAGESDAKVSDYLFICPVLPSDYI